MAQELPKQNSFTFIRLLCCLLVIFDHTWQISGVNSHLITGLGGRLSVPLFFILSGFWVIRSFFHSGSIKEYALKRFRKIIPPYWIVVFSCSVGFVFFSSLIPRDYFFNKQFAKYLLANLFTLNFLCPNLPGCDVPFGINGALWTIKIEIGFYVSLPVILLAAKKISARKLSRVNDMNKRKGDSKVKKVNAFMGGGMEYRILNSLLSILYFLSIVCVLVLPSLIEKYELLNALKNQLPSLFCYFSAGMLCLFNYELLLRCGKFLIVPCFAICILHFVYSWSFLLPFFPMALAISVIFIGFKISIFSGIKDFSYGMYLTHFPIINALSFTNVFTVHPVFGLFSVVGLSFACAYILNALSSLKIKCNKIISEARPC